MEMTPQEAAHYARLNDADRTKYIALLQSQRVRQRLMQEALRGVVAALQASKQGKVHPRLLTPQRREYLYVKELERREHYVMAKRPLLPQIIVTKKVDDYEWRDFTNTIRGRFGAIRQE